MNASIRLGQIWDIPVRLHVSWFLIFALVTWSLVMAYFPVESPGWLPAVYLAIAALTSLLYFGSVLLHELGHCWVALRNAIPVRSITLFVFGGLAQIGRVPMSPDVQLRVAIAGPLVSLTLAGLFRVLWLVARTCPYPAEPCLWLARMNLLLALFNLIPGLPLDGGWVLRALVWQLSGSYHRATQVAATTGKAMAFGFTAGGLSTAIRGELLNGLWLILIGWFLKNAAAASCAPLILRRLLQGATVAQVMSRESLQVMDDVPLERAVRPEDEALTVLEQMVEADLAQMAVVEGGQLLGIVTRGSILHHAVRRGIELGI